MSCGTDCGGGCPGADACGDDYHAHWRDACGVFGVWAPGTEAARLAYFGLYALQHRGQESAGIAAGDGEELRLHTQLGLVSQVFTEEVLHELPGDVALGHVRYSTTGGNSQENAQ